MILTPVYKCPRCNGVGTTFRPPWVPGDQSTWSGTNTVAYTCSLCDGSGLSLPVVTDTLGGDTERDIGADATPDSTLTTPHQEDR